MIFGKSYREKYIAEQKKLEKLKNKIWFAWYPVKENYGRFVWLQKIKVDYGIYNHSGYLINPKEKPIYHLLSHDQN
jgi:hypothetical protein